MRDVDTRDPQPAMNPPRWHVLDRENPDAALALPPPLARTLLVSRRSSLPLTMTPKQALDNACRLLQAAEIETNPVTMERLDEMAMSWMRIADFLSEHAELASE